MSDHRPNAGEIGAAAHLLASARELLSVAGTELALPEPLRLSEWQRRTIKALREGLVRTIEDALRAAVASAFVGDEAVHAALTSAQVRIAEPIADEHDALADPALTAALLRRAEEHRLHQAASSDAMLLLELAGDKDEALADDAMALLIALSARFDRFQEPVMARIELDAETQHKLVWTLAAALRHYLTARHGADAGAVDEAVAAAAEGLLADYDEGRSVEALSLRVARHLLEAGRLSDDLLARALAEAGLPLFLAALSLRSGLDYRSVWEVAFAPDRRGAALLLRAARVDRAAAGAILFGLDEESVEARLETFDAVSPSEAARLLRFWRFDPAYRSAIARMAA